MIDYKYKDLFSKSHVDKQLKIETDDGLFVATNSDIHWEDFELTESLCSESALRFGSCEASTAKFQILNAFIPLSGKWLTVTETLGGNDDTPFTYGRYKVFSDKPTADREYRDIIAYDAMYDIINSDASEWYNAILPNKNSTVKMRQFRENFIQHFGISEQVPEGGLVNDNMTVERTIEPEQMSGKDVITAICEINGCFGHIGRDGKFHYIYLPQDIQGLYPADFLFPDHVPEQWDYLSQAETGHLYPQTPKGEKFGNGRYIKCQYEDYVVRTINKIRIRKEENDVGATFPKTEPSEKDNCYIIQDNFLVYGKSTAELDVIAENIYNKIRGVIYRPFSAECPGNPCLEVGDPIRLQTKYKIVESYILKRTLKGIQGLRDNYSSNGLEKRSENVNSVQKSIIQLKGKANILTRTIEETKLEMYDIAAGLSTEISVTAGQIQTELNDSVNQLNNTITATAAGLEGQITDTANGLQTQITANASGLSAEVTRATGVENNLYSGIQVNAQNISTKVGYGNVVSAINQSAEEITISASKINLDGYVSAGGGNFTLDENGNLILIGSYGKLLLDGDKLKIINTTYGNEAVYSANAITHHGIQWMTVINANSSNLPKSIMIGSPTNGIDDIYCVKINGGTPITKENNILNSENMKVSYTSVGNINIMSANGYQAESEYKYGNIASTGWVQGKVAKITEKIEKLEEEIAQIKNDIAEIEIANTQFRNWTQEKIASLEDRISQLE